MHYYYTRENPSTKGSAGGLCVYDRSPCCRDYNYIRYYTLWDTIEFYIIYYIL